MLAPEKSSPDSFQKKWPATAILMLKPPTPLSTTTLSGSSYLSFSNAFEHVFKSLATKIAHRSLPRTSQGPAFLNRGDQVPRQPLADFRADQVPS